MSEKKKTEKKKKTPIKPIDDGVEVVEGGEALVQEIGEIQQAGTLQYRDAAGKIRGGADDAYAYRCFAMDVAPERARQIHDSWRMQGYEEVRGITCVGLPGARVYRTSQANAKKIDAIKAKKAVESRKAAGGSGLAGTTVDYSEHSGD